MPRTPAGGRLPHGPRHVAAALVAVGAVVLAACSTPPVEHTSAPAAPTTTVPVTSTGAAGPARTTPRTTTPPPAPSTTTVHPPPTTRSPAASTATTRVPLPPRVPATGTKRVRGVLTRIAVEPPARPDQKSHGDGDVRAFVRTADGPVEIPAPPVGHLATGRHVVADLAAGALVAAGATDTPPAVPAPPKRAVHEVVTALVLPPGADPDATTTAGLRAAVDGPVSRYWTAQTGGRIGFRVSRSFGWLRVRSSCDDAWGLWGEVAARVRFVPAPRRHLVVLVPASLTGCYAGLGTIGADPGEGGFSYVRGTLSGLVAHELGHNLGLGHSNGLQCQGVTDAAWSAAGWSARCVRTAYRDWYDVMGISWERLGTLSTAQAYRLGVLGDGGVTTVTGPARVTLTAVSLHAGLRSLRVRTPSGVVYTVEYRPARGDDAWLAGDWRGLRPGVLVRRDDPAGESGQTLLLDASPSRVGGFERDWDAPIGAGAALTTADGVVLRVEEQTPTTAQVVVQVDGKLPPSPEADLARLGSRLAGSGSSRVRRTPAVAPTPSSEPSPRTPERARGPVHQPTR